jgi:hypothetical protein
MKVPNAFASNGPLVWAQPKALRREYQLKNDDELVGGLRFEKSYGSLATAEVASQDWTFKREGFLHPRVTVRTPIQTLILRFSTRAGQEAAWWNFPMAAKSVGVTPVFGDPNGLSFRGRTASCSSSSSMKVS